MGFMKQGVSIMGLFFATIAVAATLNIGPLTIVLPIIWCYSFFNVHNMYSLSDEEFYALEDDYIFHLMTVFYRSISGANSKIKLSQVF